MLDPSRDNSGTYTYTVDNGLCGKTNAAVTIGFTAHTFITNYQIKVNSFSEVKSIVVLIAEEDNFEFSFDGINY